MYTVPSSYATIFFFNDTATTEIYTLSLHDALPISLLVNVADRPLLGRHQLLDRLEQRVVAGREHLAQDIRSEEHTSELQSRLHLVCRLLLEKKNYLRRLRWHRGCGH